MSEAMPKRRILERRQALVVALCSRDAVESRDSLISEPQPTKPVTRRACS